MCIHFCLLRHGIRYFVQEACQLFSLFLIYIKSALKILTFFFYFGSNSRHRCLYIKRAQCRFNLRKTLIVFIGVHRNNQLETATIKPESLNDSYTRILNISLNCLSKNLFLSPLGQLSLDQPQVIISPIRLRIIQHKKFSVQNGKKTTASSKNEETINSKK